MKIHSSSTDIFHHASGYGIFSADSQQPERITFMARPVCWGKWQSLRAGGLHPSVPSTRPWWRALALALKLFPFFMPLWNQGAVMEHGEQAETPERQGASQERIRGLTS